MEQISGYLSLCYHYIRPEKTRDRFPKIMCTREDEFLKHLAMLKERFSFISVDDAYNFAYENGKMPQERLGMLITLDDGLSDHYRAAQILAEHGIKALFSIPTCIIEDGLPANPPIINYTLAVYRIEGFLSAYRDALEARGLSVASHNILFEKGKDNPWTKIREIKDAFKYRMQHKDARSILLHIYKNLLQRDHPNAMELMHLTQSQIEDMVHMGHSIGGHSHTHISVGAHKLSQEEFQKEMIDSRRLLENKFKTPVYALSYPHGAEQDCLPSEELIKNTNEYKLAFTTSEMVNTQSTPPFELGRYMPRAEDTAELLSSKLSEIISKSMP